MKVAHMCIVTPGRCGLYETTRELVKGLREAGVDSRLIDIPDSNKVYPKGYPHKEDRGAPLASMEWATGADVIVNHSGYDNTPVAETGQPIVHVAHGRPRSSFLGEVRGGTPIYSYHYRKNADPRWKAVVTFWPQHERYLQVMFPDKPVHVVQSSVDLEAWSPGEKRYDFHGHAGEVNVVCTDAWREDVDPFLPLNAVCLWARQRKCVKFHLYAKPKSIKGYSAIIRRMQDDGSMGELMPWVDGLKHVYRAADFVVTANEIDTRTVREAMACGCPVVKIRGVEVDDFDLALSQDRGIVRMNAEKSFDPRVTALEFKRVLECSF